MRSLFRRVFANCSSVGPMDNAASSSHSDAEQNTPRNGRSRLLKRKNCEDLSSSEPRKRPRNSTSSSREAERDERRSDSERPVTSSASSQQNALLSVPTGVRTCSPDSGPPSFGYSRSPTPALTSDLPSSDFDSSIGDPSEPLFADLDILCHSDDDKSVQAKRIQP